MTVCFNFISKSLQSSSLFPVGLVYDDIDESAWKMELNLDDDSALFTLSVNGQDSRLFPYQASGQPEGPTTIHEEAVVKLNEKMMDLDLVWTPKDFVYTYWLTHKKAKTTKVELSGIFHVSSGEVFNGIVNEISENIGEDGLTEIRLRGIIGLGGDKIESWPLSLLSVASASL